MNEFLDSLGQHKFFYFCHEIPLIAIYDDFFYSRNDYDHLCPLQRRLIEKILIENSFKRGLKGRYSRHDGKVAILKSTNLGVSPLREIQLALEDNDYVFVSPLGYFLFALAADVGIDVLKGLVKKCPVNLMQAKDFAVHEDFYEKLRQTFPEITNYQNEFIEEHKFKKIKF